jgi:hypothetical protein
VWVLLLDTCYLETIPVLQRMELVIKETIGLLYKQLSDGEWYKDLMGEKKSRANWQVAWMKTDGWMNGFDSI